MKQLQDPLVCVVITCYNYGRYLDDAITSVLQSTYTNYQIIIVDDGSTDHESIQMLNFIASKYPNVMVHTQPNKGTSAARNTGIQLTSAPYILTLDADDKIEPTFIEEGITSLEQDSSISYIYSLVQLFGNSNKIWRTIPYNLLYLKFHNFVPAGIIIRRSHWEEIGGYDEQMKDGYEDWEFVLRLGFHKYKGKHINKVLYYYRKHGESLSTNTENKHKQLVEYIRNKHHENYKMLYLQFSLYCFIELRVVLANVFRDKFKIINSFGKS
jgi:glycosyltransferase involved in cell wall biosynthesis